MTTENKATEKIDTDPEDYKFVIMDYKGRVWGKDGEWTESSKQRMLFDVAIEAHQHAIEHITDEKFCVMQIIPARR